MTKTNTDAFASISCAPFICTSSFLNKDCPNDDSNYMVLGYIPNLGYRTGKAKKQTAEMKLQDEHNCLSLITNQIIKIHDEGGFWTEVAMIEFVSDDGTIATCPAMIMAFVQYNITLGIPTPQFTGEEEL
jgi:hypothetical protein